MVIAGFELCDAGQILVGGRDIGALSPYRRDLGMAFQRCILLPNMSVLENVAFPLKMRGVAKAEREARAKAALDKSLREEVQLETKHLQREIGITVVLLLEGLAGLSQLRRMSTSSGSFGYHAAHVTGPHASSRTLCRSAGSSIDRRSSVIGSLCWSSEPLLISRDPSAA